MLQFLKHLFTGKDNQTFDLGRVLWALGVIALIAFTGWHVWEKCEFDAMSYGTGLGALLGGGGAGIAIKKGTEPE